MISEKNRIRQEAKAYRDRLQIDPAWAGQAADLFLGGVPVADGQVVSVYYPIGHEIDPSPIVEGLWSKGITVCLPIIQQGRRELVFAEWRRDSKLVQASFGTFEPEEQAHTIAPDILIIPLLAFDQHGNRMGYGQGHYDETLSGLRAQKTVLAVGLAYAEQAVLLALPTEPHDQRLDLVVTPQRIFDFRD